MAGGNLYIFFSPSRSCFVISRRLPFNRLRNEPYTTKLLSRNHSRSACRFFLFFSPLLRGRSCTSRSSCRLTFVDLRFLLYEKKERGRNGFRTADPWRREVYSYMTNKPTRPRRPIRGIVRRSASKCAWQVIRF